MMTKRLIIGIVIVCIFLLLVVGFRKGFINTTKNISFIFTTPTPTPDPMAPKNFLLLGYGGGIHEGALLTDTMIIVHVIPKTKQVILITIPRDVWVNLPLTANGVGEKINAAYAYGFDTRQYLDRPSQFTGINGGGKLAMYATAQVIGMPIDGYVAISFEGFKNALTTFGPVSVSIPYTFEDKFYPIDGKEKDTCGKTSEEMQQASATASGDILQQLYMCRYETIKFEKGTQILDAEQALKFVRSRHSETNPGDFYRSLRQQALIQGVVAKIKTIGGLVKLPAMIPQFAKMVTSDITVPQALSMLSAYGDPLGFRLSRISLTDNEVLVASTSGDGQYILAPQSGNGFNSVKQYISGQINQMTATPSATP
jgi:anionic cell wall polymer biosynthesis LytR-Cps2A-Psr (LCP) family protein